MSSGIDRTVLSNSESASDISSLQAASQLTASTKIVAYAELTDVYALVD